MTCVIALVNVNGIVLVGDRLVGIPGSNAIDGSKVHAIGQHLVGRPALGALTAGEGPLFVPATIGSLKSTSVLGLAAETLKIFKHHMQRMEVLTAGFEPQQLYGSTLWRGRLELASFGEMGDPSHRQLNKEQSFGQYVRGAAAFLNLPAWEESYSACSLKELTAHGVLCNRVASTLSGGTIGDRTDVLVLTLSNRFSFTVEPHTAMSRLPDL